MPGHASLVRRSLVLRHVDCGSCNACESELAMLFSPHYDAERSGLAMAASPRHADAVIVTGPGTMQMRQALARTYEAVGEPKWVIALGDCACDGGVHAAGYAVDSHVGSASLRPDLGIPGCPPSPAEIGAALRELMRGEVSPPPRAP